MIGYVPDYFGVYDNLKVSEYMEFFRLLLRPGRIEGENQDYDAVRTGGTGRPDGFLRRRPLQRHETAAVSGQSPIHDPQLLILDEPTSGMDPRSRFDFKEIIRELHQQGKTILISSHLLSELSEVCTDLGIIDEGHMVLSGNMQGDFGTGRQFQAIGNYGEWKTGAGHGYFEKPSQRPDYFSKRKRYYGGIYRRQ